VTAVTVVSLGSADAKILRAIADGLPVTRTEQRRARHLEHLGLLSMPTPGPDRLTAEGAASLAFFDEAAP